jgi:hypothetical protein
MYVYNELSIKYAYKEIILNAVMDASVPVRGALLFVCVSFTTPQNTANDANSFQLDCEDIPTSSQKKQGITEKEVSKCKQSVTILVLQVHILVVT